MRASIILLVFILPFCLCAKPKEKAKHNQMALKDDLRAYWNMGQNPLLFPVHDQSGNGNHLTGFNAPTLTAGKIGDAILFNGTDQYLSIASSSGFSHQGNEFTAFIWFKPLALSNNKIIATTTEWGVLMVESGGAHYINIAVEDEDVTVTDVPLVVGQWYFIALGYKEFSQAAEDHYIWGSVNLSPRVLDSQSGLTPSSTVFSMGGTSAIGWVNGVIDDAAIFRRALSDQELAQIYNDADGLPFEDYDKVIECKVIDCCD